MTLVPEMMATLKKSIVEIALAGGENVEATLMKSFAEFEDAFAPELGKAVVAGAEEIASEVLAKSTTGEPLYKGLGSVGRIANLLSMVADMTKRLEDGDGSDDDDADVPPDHVLMLLHHAVGAIELALRAAVNEHVEPVDDDEAPEDGYSYVHVGNVEDPDDDAGMVVKSVLPEALAKMATDPGAISIAVVQAGSALLLEAGVSEAQLSKAFGLAEPGGRLAKAVDPNADPDADQSANPGTDPNADPDASQDPNAGGFDLMAQLEILGRIQAAGLMQIDHIVQNVQAITGVAAGDDTGADAGAVGADAGGADAVPPGGDDASQQAPAPGGDASGSAPPAAEENEPADKPPVRKDVENSELRKLRDQIAALEKREIAVDPALIETRAQVADLQTKLAKLAAEPTPFKGVARATGLSKQTDSGGEDDELSKLAAEFDRAPTSDAKQQVLLKMAFKFPNADLKPLAKMIAPAAS